MEMRHTMNEVKKEGMLSVIIPSYNEELNILNTTRTVARILDEQQIVFELIFVDDGSKDQTYEKIKEAKKEECRVRGIHFSRNFGKESCIFAGLA